MVAHNEMMKLGVVTHSVSRGPRTMVLNRPMRSSVVVHNGLTRLGEVLYNGLTRSSTMAHNELIGSNASLNTVLHD